MARSLRALAGRLGASLRAPSGGSPAATTPTSPEDDASLVDLVARTLAETGGTRAAVVAGPGSRARVAALRRSLPETEITVLRTDHTDADQRHVALVAGGPWDVIIDVGPARGRRTRFANHFYHLASGGSLIVADAGEAADPDSTTPLGSSIRAARARRGEPAPRPRQGIAPSEFDEHALGASLGSVARDGAHLCVTQALPPPAAKLREHECDLLINGLDNLGSHTGHRVLAVIPGQHFTSRGSAYAEDKARRRLYPSEYDAPAATLREYRDVVVAPYQIVTDGRVLFPDTFRHNARGRIRNSHTTEVAPRFARLGFDPGAARPIEGAYFHLDNEVRGHFGHLLTETVSRLWAWPEAKERVPDLKALVGTNRRPELLGYELRIYEAAGIAPDDVVLIDEPVRVDRLLSASPMLSHPQYVHPAIADTWRRIGDHLAADAAGGPRPARIFCSRRLDKRSCHNGEEVERLFADAGFAVIFPEDYSLGDQVEMFRSAEVIAGYAGSGMFQLAFTTEPTRMIQVGSTAYTARNEYLIAAVGGHDLEFVACPPDDPTDFQSPFLFDEAASRQVRTMLETLDPATLS